jgi:hypothetical protein
MIDQYLPADIMWICERTDIRREKRAHKKKKKAKEKACGQEVVLCCFWRPGINASASS